MKGMKKKQLHHTHTQIQKASIRDYIRKCHTPYCYVCEIIPIRIHCTPSINQTLKSFENLKKKFNLGKEWKKKFFFFISSSSVLRRRFLVPFERNEKRIYLIINDLCVSPALSALLQFISIINTTFSLCVISKHHVKWYVIVSASFFLLLLLHVPANTSESICLL